MANSILTPTMVTREALVILHQKLNFIGSINRGYDSSFAVSGAKIGDTLKIRLPNQYTVRTNATLSTQTTSESSVTLQVSNQYGVDTSFTSTDLTLSLQDFSERILEPAMSVLAANVESKAFEMVKDVYQCVDNQTDNSMTLAVVLAARQKLVEALAPAGKWTSILTPADNVALVNQLKALFQDSTAIKEQYREGMMGRTAGFDFYENTLLSNLTSGTMSQTSVSRITGTVTPATETSAITVGNSLVAGTMVQGDVFTIATLNRVHPETKADTGQLQQFVLTTNVTLATNTSISFSPPIIMSGAKQNVISTAISTQLINKIGASAGVLQQSLFHHRDAFTFATADLLMPKGVHFAAREVLDGLSLRIVQQYTISDDAFPARIDILFGYKTIRPELAVKTWT